MLTSCPGGPVSPIPLCPAGPMSPFIPGIPGGPGGPGGPCMYFNCDDEDMTARPDSVSRPGSPFSP
jgi:hypothetical protein